MEVLRRGNLIPTMRSRRLHWGLRRSMMRGDECAIQSHDSVYTLAMSVIPDNSAVETADTLFTLITPPIPHPSDFLKF